MIKTTGLVHFSIAVSDMEKSVAFYTEILDFKVIRRYPNMAFCRSGDDTPIVILVESELPINPNPGNQTAVHHAFRIDAEDYDDTVAFLKDKGIEIVFEEDRVPPATISGQRAYIHDPDRNVIELIDWVNPGQY